MRLSATTYVKLQQAYISEAVAVGTWGIIGYKGPGENTTSGSAKSSTTNFTYEDASSGYTNNTVALATGITGWAASNNANLNDCTAGKNWTIATGAATSGSEGDAEFTATVATTSDCTSLTPNFDKIGK